MGFKIGRTVDTADGHRGKVIQVDSARKQVAVEITHPGTPGTRKGEERVYHEKDLR